MNTNIYTEKKTETACSRKEENEKKKHFDGNEIERKRESQTTKTTKKCSLQIVRFHFHVYRQIEGERENFTLSIEEVAYDYFPKYRQIDRKYR